MKEKVSYPIFQEIKIVKQSKQTQLLLAVYAKQNFEPELKFLYKSDFLKWAAEILSLKCDIDIKEFYYPFKELVRKGFIREFLKPGLTRTLFEEWNCEILESGLKYLEELFPYLKISGNEEQKSEEIIILEEKETQTEENACLEIEIKENITEEKVTELDFLEKLLINQIKIQKNMLNRLNCADDRLFDLTVLLTKIEENQREIIGYLKQVKSVGETQKEAEELKQELCGVLEELKSNPNNH